MNNDESQRRLEAELRELRPASAPIDAQSLFYRAGYEAGISAASQPGSDMSSSSASNHKRLRRFLPAIAAGFVVAIVSIPASYQAGHQAAIESTPQLAPPDPPGVQPGQSQPANQEPISPSPQQSHEAMLAGGEHESMDNVATAQVQQAIDGRRTIDADPFAESKSRLLAKWLAPFDGMAESSKLDRQTQSTLTVGHASLVARADSGWNWVNFPFAVTSDNKHAIADPSATDPNSPLAATDMNEIAITLEAIR